VIAPIAVSIAEKGFMQADVVDSLVDWSCIRVDSDLQWLSRLRRVAIDSKAYCDAIERDVRMSTVVLRQEEMSAVRR
jgi:hypothetical protein